MLNWVFLFFESIFEYRVSRELMFVVINCFSDVNYLKNSKTPARNITICNSVGHITRLNEGLAEKCNEVPDESASNLNRVPIFSDSCQLQGTKRMNLFFVFIYLPKHNWPVFPKIIISAIFYALFI